MKYHKMILLKNGTECCLRNGTEQDGQAVLDNFSLTHGETDYLLSYPEENSFDTMQESRFLKKKSESENEIEIVAVVDNEVVGIAGIDAVGKNTRCNIAPSLELVLQESFGGLESGRH